MKIIAFVLTFYFLSVGLWPVAFVFGIITLATLGGRNGNVQP